MDKPCNNHPQKTAISNCHSCGLPYCEDCLNEGSEFYYCFKPECRAAFEATMLPEIVTCPECLNKVTLLESERVFKKFQCPHCTQYIDWGSYNDPGDPPIEYIYFAESMNMGDIALVQSILDETDIDYFIEGANFIAVRPLVQAAKIHIRKDQQEIVRELLKDFEFHNFGTSNTSYDASNDSD